MSSPSSAVTPAPSAVTTAPDHPRPQRPRRSLPRAATGNERARLTPRPRQARSLPRPQQLPAGRTAFAALTGPAGAYLTFDTTANRTVLAKVGLSFVSTAGAASNLVTENPNGDFASIHTAAYNAWNSLLERIQKWQLP